MKKLFTILITVLCIAFSSTNSKASHMMGGYISYLYADTNEYVVTLHLYRDCAGIAAPASTDLCISSVSAGVSFTLTLMPVAGTGNVLPMSSCVPYTANCAAGIGTEEWVYQGTMLLPQEAQDWVIGFELCCRNAAITTLTNAANYGLYIYADLDNSNGLINSSPIFNDTIFSQYCAGVYSTIDYSCYDYDGDSLVYSLQPAEDAAGCPLLPITIGYNIPFSPSYPLSSFTPIGFNSSNGLFDWTPAQIEVGEICMRIDEYRNGVLIGSFKRDDQIAIVQGIQNPDLIKGRVFMDYNSNNVQDAGEPGKAGEVLVALPVGIYATTDSAGDYALPTITGTYSALIPYPPTYFSVVPDSNSATFTALGQVDSLNDFALQPDTFIYDLSLFGCANLFGLPCDTVYQYYTVTNSGTLPESGTLTVNMNPALTVLSATPAADSIIGNVAYWNITNLLPQHSLSFMLPLVINCNDSLGTVYTYTASVSTSHPDANIGDNNFTSWLDIDQMPLDPNYIEVDHTIISPNFIASQDWLTYTIHFQNIGGAPAINVHISDGLDFNADPGSFEMISSSFPCTFNLSGIGLLNFYFNNINLVPQFISDPASQGFVQYRIKPKSYLNIGDKIQNAANIFFDSNPPVTTNTVQTIVASVTSVNEITSGALDAVVYPNPFTSQLYVKLDHAGKINFDLVDMVGRTLIKKQITRSCGFDCSHLSKGLYIYRLYNENGNYKTGKLIKN